VKLQAVNKPVVRYLCIVVLIACQIQVSEIRTRVISVFVQRTEQGGFQCMKLLKDNWTQDDDIKTCMNRVFFFYLGITADRTYCHPEVTKVLSFVNVPYPCIE
jgi:hypothetical protein